MELSIPFYSDEKGSAAGIYNLLGFGCSEADQVKNAVTYLKAAYNQTKRNLVHAAERIKREELTEKKRKLQAEMEELAAEEAEMNKQRELKKQKKAGAQTASELEIERA